MGCLACTTGRGASGGPLRHEVAAYTQFASPELVGRIAYAGLDPADDPRWAESGAATVQEYARWCRHGCGMACLQMVLRHRDGHAPPMLELLRASLPYGTYRTDPDGTVHGLFYRAFLAYVADRHGLTGAFYPQPHLTLDRVRTELDRGALVLASVHNEIRRPDRPAPGRGGHLVLVTGHDPVTDTLFFCNPSGHTAESRTAELPAAVFDTFFGWRGIAVEVDRGRGAGLRPDRRGPTRLRREAAQ